MRRLALALALALLAAAALAPAAHAEGFAIASASASLSTNQAGAHPDLTTSLEIETDSENTPLGTLRNLTVDLPPGFSGNPNAVPQCSAVQLFTSVSGVEFSEGCPIGSQVGLTTVVLGKASGGGIAFKLTEPVYNMQPPGDGRTVARLGFVAGIFPTLIDIEVRTEDDYGISVMVEGASAQLPLISATTTIWGVPAHSSHDAQRLTPEEAWLEVTPPPRSSGVTPAPFLTNPTRCGVPLTVSVAADSYGEPGRISRAAAGLPTIGGCGGLDFQPGFAATPTSSAASAPSGLHVELTIPQDETHQGQATSHLREARVALPEGMTISPGAADGLAACSAAQVGLGTRGPSGCPDAAKIGTAEFEVPALPGTLHGSIYQRSPEPDRLFRVWLVAEGHGVNAKIAGEIELDPNTGQVASLFLDNPQVPIREVELRLFGGPRGPLATPRSCGLYFTRWEFTPWSGNPPVSGKSPMQIDRGCDTGGFAPRLSAGATSPLAGRYSPFVLNLTRASGEQNVAGLEVAMPPGLVAKLEGVPLCPEALAGAGACPPASQVGRVATAVGPGPAPLWVPQPGRDPTAVYLAGPYRGAPLSLVAVVPAQAGPFDLGEVVTRAAIDVDPRTARVSVKPDPLPQMLEGVPLSYRHIHVAVDRPGFTRNPTSCEEMAVQAAVTSDAGALSTPSSRFQVGGCRDLGFEPRLGLRLKGGTKRGANPGLRAVLRPRPGDANISRTVVRLPRSAFLDQGHIRTVCTRVQFARDACPEGAIYGRAAAHTPLLDRPLRGPVYLRSSDNLLPDLVLDLKGTVDVEAVARIDSVRGGIRAIFAGIPDVPVKAVVVAMLGGKKGLIVNSTDLCASRNRAVVRLAAHNGRRHRLRPVVRASCGKKRGTAKRKRRAAINSAHRADLHHTKNR